MNKTKTNETDILLANKRLQILREYRNEHCMSKLKKFVGIVNKQICVKKRKKLPVIHDSLKTILPEAIYNSITKISLNNGILYITSNNQTWKSQVEMFHRDALLSSLKACLGNEFAIRKICFK